MNNDYQDDAKWSIVCTKGGVQHSAEIDPNNRKAIDQAIEGLRICLGNESVSDELARVIRNSRIEEKVRQDSAADWAAASLAQARLGRDWKLSYWDVDWPGGGIIR